MIIDTDEIATPHPLCCCEYINKNNERNHILACCCNCVEIDTTFERLICCKPIPPALKRKMMDTIQDRIRIPWRGGAKQISIETLLPFFIVPIILSVAAINFFCLVPILIATPVCLKLLQKKFIYTNRQSKFFFSWIIASIGYMWILFEFKAPLLLILPIENLIFIFFIILTLYFFWKTKRNANFNLLEVSDYNDSESIIDDHTILTVSDHDSDRLIDESRCPVCFRTVPSRAFHCYICQRCILRRDHHNVWLDCCIGEWNHKYYIAGCISAVTTLLVAINLTLTTTCRPYIWFKLFGILILLPEDCSEVFDIYEMSIIFACAVYAGVMLCWILATLLRQFYLISMGITSEERQRGIRFNHQTCGGNWKSFFC